MLFLLKRTEIHMKIGVLGGTFDPVHNGHIFMAQHCMDNLSFDRIMFLPNGNPPHKKDRNITDKIHRYYMLKFALMPYDKFFVSDYEIKREEYSYTVETMRHFRETTDDEYVIIIGADSFYQLGMWYNFSELVKENQFVVLDREYNANTALNEDISIFNQKYNSHISLCQMPMVDISSTDIRNKLIKNEDVTDMIPRCVMQYITDNNLYR